MSRDKISDWSATAGSNTDVGGVNINEGCPPATINNAIREMMAQVKDQQTGADNDNFTVGGNLTVDGTSTLTGIPTGPTAVAGTNTTQLATTAFVTTATGTLGTMQLVQKLYLPLILVVVLMVIFGIRFNNVTYC